MPAITWTANLSVNIAAIDKEHQKLVALINELDAAMASGKGKDILAKILGALISYTQTHFGNEERLMAQQGYPEAAQHCAEHLALTRKVLDLQSQFQQNRIGLTIPTLKFLTDWLTTHILGTDKKYGPYLNGKGIR
jgi:hemerythrin